MSGTIDIDKVVKGGLVATGFKAKAALEEGVFVLHDARASFFGGRVDAAGTRVDLSQANPTWNLKAKLDAIDLGQALTSFAGAAPLAGKMTGALDLNGAGVDWATLQKALTGYGALSVKAGELTTTDLGDKVLGAVAQGLRAAGKTGLAGQVGGAGGKTSLRDLAAQFTVKDGAMALPRPLSFTAPFGAAELGGKIGLGGQLALTGAAKVSKETLQSLVGGSKLPLGQGVSVPLALSGSLMQPSVNVQADQAVAGLVQGAAKQKVQELKDTVQERPRSRRGRAWAICCAAGSCELFREGALDRGRDRSRPAQARVPLAEPRQPIVGTEVHSHERQPLPDEELLHDPALVAALAQAGRAVVRHDEQRERAAGARGLGGRAEDRRRDPQGVISVVREHLEELRDPGTCRGRHERERAVGPESQPGAPAVDVAPDLIRDEDRDDRDGMPVPGQGVQQAKIGLVVSITRRPPG